jgi:hypothetical protein
MKKSELRKIIKEEINGIIQGRGLPIVRQIIKKMESSAGSPSSVTDRDNIIDLYTAVKALMQHAEDQQRDP